jgi:hypothetical protein
LNPARSQLRDDGFAQHGQFLSPRGTGDTHVQHAAIEFDRQGSSGDTRADGGFPIARRHGCARFTHIAWRHDVRDASEHRTKLLNPAQRPFLLHAE